MRYIPDMLPRYICILLLGEGKKHPMIDQVLEYDPPNSNSQDLCPSVWMEDAQETQIFPPFTKFSITS